MIHKNKILILLGHIRIETLHRTAQNITHKESKEQNLYVYKQKYMYVNMIKCISNAWLRIYGEE